jgi:CRP-like cAMP-binding protein
MMLIVSGRITLEGEDAASVDAGSGAVIGLFETLGGTPLGRDVVAAEDGIALRIAREEFFEILGEHPALMRRLFARLFGRRDATVAAGV